MARYKLSEQNFRQAVTQVIRNGKCNVGNDSLSEAVRRAVLEAAKQMVNELDWKTYMNAARKSQDQKDYKRRDKFEKAAVDSFQQKHGKNGHSFQYEGDDEPTSYRGRDTWWKHDNIYGDSTFDRKAPTEDGGWWHGEPSDGQRHYRYGNGKPGLKAGKLTDDTYDYAYSDKDGWTGDNERKWTAFVDRNGERYSPDLSTVGNEVSQSGDKAYNDALKGMSDDMYDYYSGQTQYEKGRGWTK